MEGVVQLKCHIWAIILSEPLLTTYSPSYGLFLNAVMKGFPG